jgi:hypothetical protein
MARPRKILHRLSVKELVQQQRDELYAAGHQNINMSLPVPVVAMIDELKKRYKLRSRDAVVGRIIRKCMNTLPVDSFVLRPLPPADKMQKISPIVAGELADYMQEIQARFRHISYGPIFETILAKVGTDLSVAPVQLELMQRNMP